MPQCIRLADPAMGQLMGITDDDWTNISQLIDIVLDLRRGRVNEAITFQGIAPSRQKFLDTG